MKTLVFSDTHLTRQFDPKKFTFLVKLINEADQVIINGDFWDSWFTSFDDFVNSKWSQLFPLLLRKRAVYLYGNHDPAEKCDDRVQLFSVEAKEDYVLTYPTQTYSFQHGNKILKDKRSRGLEIYSRILDTVDDTIWGSLVHRVLHFLEYLGYTVLGREFMTGSQVARRSNEIMKKLPHGESFLVCGDTHCPELDITHRYANSGCILYRHATYLTINSKGITLQKQDY